MVSDKMPVLDKVIFLNLNFTYKKSLFLRCTLEPGTSWNTNPSNLLSVFKTEAFQFNFQNSAAVYVECLVRVCLVEDSSNECAFCTLSTRKRRALSVGNLGNEGTLSVVKSPTFYVITKGCYYFCRCFSKYSFSFTTFQRIISYKASLIYEI